MIIKGDKSNLAEECGVKLFEQGVRNKECQQTYINTANMSFTPHSLFNIVSKSIPTCSLSCLIKS